MSSVRPFVRVDHLVIGVRDLREAEAAYSTVLGVAPSWRGVHTGIGTRNVVYGLRNCYLELLGPGTASTAHPFAAALASALAEIPERLFAIALGTDDLDAARAVLREAGVDAGPALDVEAVADDGAVRRGRVLALGREQARGVMVLAIEHDRAAVGRAAPRAPQTTAVTAVDHVVLFSDDLEGALRLWRDTFGIPERWRREFPERGTINVGLRLGGVMLELVAPLGAAAGERGERLWGVAYTVDDCDGTVARLRAAAVPVTDARPGLAPATRVATVKWAERTPTLVLQHTERTRERTS